MRTPYIVAGIIIIILLILGFVQCTRKPVEIQTPPLTPQSNTPAPVVTRTLTFNIGLTKQFFTRTDLPVQAGDTIILHVTAADMDHSVSIPDFNLREVIAAGQEATFTFVVKKGTTLVMCTDKCDPNVVMKITAQ